MKRLFDIIVSLIGIIVLSPVFLILALVIVIDSPGGVFFRGVRVGQNGKDFRIYKFRSMKMDAEKDGKAIFQGGDPVQCRENAGRCDPGNAPGGGQGG